MYEISRADSFYELDGGTQNKRKIKKCDSFMKKSGNVDNLLKINRKQSIASTRLKMPFNKRDPKKKVIVYIDDLSGRKSEIEVNFDKRIDKGGFSEVFQGCLHGDENRKVAIKVIPFGDKNDYNVKNSEVKDIEREISFLKLLNNFEGSVNYRGSFKSKSSSLYYIAFDYYDSDLNKFFIENKALRKKIDINVKISFINQMIMIMSNLQKRGILHRDLKSKNFLLNISEMPSEMKIKICDFGTAVYSKELKDKIPLAGTRAYMATEYICMLDKGDESKNKDIDNNANKGAENHLLKGEKVEKLDIMASSYISNESETINDMNESIIETENTIVLSQNFEIACSSSFKSDVFSLGLNILFLLGRRSDKCNVDEVALKSALKFVQEKTLLPPAYLQVLNMTLEWERDKRPDFIYLEDYLIYVNNCPLDYVFPSPKIEEGGKKKQFVSSKAFQGIQDETDNEKIFKYFADNGWKNVTVSIKFFEQIYLMYYKPLRFPEDLEETFTNNMIDTKGKAFFKYMEILEEKKSKPFDALCECYTVEGELYKDLNQNMAFDRISGDITTTYLQMFIKFSPLYNLYAPKCNVVYRGLVCSERFPDLAFNMRSQYMVDLYFYWTAFVSTSKDKNEALKFCLKEGSGQCILFEIMLNPLNSKGKYDISKISKYKIEAEVLLAPYFYFKVVSTKAINIQDKNFFSITIEEATDEQMPFKILWLDRRIKKEYNSKCLAEISDLGYYVQGFKNLKEMLDILTKDDRGESYFVITSGSDARDNLRIINDLSSVKMIGIFCFDEKTHKTWATKETYSKLVFVTSEFAQIKSFLKKVMRYFPSTPSNHKSPCIASNNLFNIECCTKLKDVKEANYVFYSNTNDEVQN